MEFTQDKLKQARDAGYSDDEIWGFASQQDDRFNKAKEAGYSLDEVSGFLSQQAKQPEGVPVMEPNPQRDYEMSASMVKSLSQARDENYGRYNELSQLPERTPETVAEMVKSFEAGKQAELNLYKEQETLGKLQSQLAEQEKQRQVAEAQKAREESIKTIKPPEPIIEDVGQIEGIKNAAMNAFDSSRQAMAVAGGVSPEEAETISQLEYQKEARKLSPAYSEYLQAEGIDAVRAFAKNPFEITTNIIAEGLAGSLYSLGAGVAAGGIAAGATAVTGVGAPLAPAAFLGGQIGGTFAGSLATEYGSKVLEELQNAGMDIKDPKSIQKFFSDEKLMEGARSQALKRGVPVAIFDGVSAGIGGRLARLPVQALTKTPTRLAVTEGVMQAALGGGGEIAGAVAAGEEIQPKAIFAEVVGEVGPAAAEITVGRIAERMARTPEQKKLDQIVLATQVATRASQDIAPATADAVERQVQDRLAETAETPEQRLAQLQAQAKAASEITLEEETAQANAPQAQARITEREGQVAQPVETPTGTRLEAAAYQTPDGTVYFGADHLEAMGKARDAGKIDQAAIDEKQTVESRETPEFGFATDKEAFIGRSQAEVVASGSGQLKVEQPATGLLHSNEVVLDAFPSGLPAQPVTPTPEAPPVAPVAPVEPVVTEGGVQPPVTPEVVPKAENAVVEAEQKSEQESDTVKVFRGVAEAGALPTGGAFFTDSERDASAYAQLAALRKAVEDNDDFNDIVSDIMAEEGANDITDLSINTIKSIIEGNNIQVGDISEGAVLRGNVRLGNVLNLESFGSEVGSLPETWNELNELGLVAETWQDLDEDVQDELLDKYRGKAFYSLLEGEVNLNEQFAKGVDTIVFTDQNTEGKGTHRTYLTKAAEQFSQEPEAAPVTPTPTEVAPTPTAEPPTLAPLRRVAKAEQTEDDVSGLVGQGLVELYKGQPVITQAGLEALPEAERPRLTPEARKIQIDRELGETVPPTVEAAPEARGTVAGIVGEPTVTAYENQQGQNRSRLEKEVAAVPAPAWGTNPNQKRTSLEGFTKNWVNRYQRALQAIGVAMGYDQRGAGAAGIQGNYSITQISPSGFVSIIIGSGVNEGSVASNRGETESKRNSAIDIEEEIIHAIYFKKLLESWDGNGDASEFTQQILAQRVGGMRTTLGESVFRQLADDVVRSYYKGTRSEEYLSDFVSRIEANEVYPSSVFMHELARMAVQNKVRGITSEEAYYSVIETVSNYVKEMLNAIRQFLSNPSLLGADAYNDIQAIAQEFQAMVDGLEPVVQARESRREPVPRFTEESPEAKTLSTMRASMEKVDAASEAKGGKFETQKISDIAANWMESGGDTRALQDAITEFTNLSPANAQKVANAIARQYDIQQSIAETVIETAEGISLEGLPEGVAIPKEADPKRPKTVIQRLIDATTGVRVKPTILQVNEKTALREQIRMKAATTRAAKAAQQETAQSIVDAIKALGLRGPVKEKQALALAKKAAQVIWTSEKSVERFMVYAENVVANANYDADLRDAKLAQKRAKDLSKRDSIAAPQRYILERIANIGINTLEDPREFADIMNHYMRSFKPAASPDYVVVPDSEIVSYLSQAEDISNNSKNQFEADKNQRLADKYGISIDELEPYLRSLDIERDLVGYAKREAVEGILNEKANDVKDGLRGVDQTLMRADQRKILESMMAIDTKSLSPQEKQDFIKIGNNIIFNNQTNGAEFFTATAKGQQSAKELAKDAATVQKNRAWVNLLPTLGSERVGKFLKGVAGEWQSIADTFRNAFGKDFMSKFYEKMGMLDLDVAFNSANRTLEKIQESMAEFYTNLEKKYKGAARDQDGILSEGVVGFLIQGVPDKNESDSLSQRRGLIQQDIKERRASNEKDRVKMADRIESILQKIDGDTVEEILGNLKREYPANYESLMWLKDELFPKYKDFLKNFDENFNDQANNYTNPDYLPIAFVNSGPSLDIMETSKKYYNGMSLAPKQSSYTIKRSDYVVLPIGENGKIKEIGFNLRKNAYNSLSDQITKAHTSSAWQRIDSFLKTPEAEEALGGQANREFFAQRIRRLKESRERRGLTDTSYISRTLDIVSNLARAIGTRIALAGFDQFVKQPSDQLTVAAGTSGRFDLLAESLAPRAMKLARPLLDKFSIGRRGDASSGYKYINQMEGAQSRLERFYTEGNWVKAKEWSTKLADKFLIPLKTSDFHFAAAAWMTYYRAYLDKNNIPFEGWEREAELVDTDERHRMAAAHAENMTDIYQGSSDPTKMATFAQKGKTGWENAGKALLVPFNSFAIQFRSRIASDLTEAMTKSGMERAKAIKDLSSTIGGAVAFGMVRRIALPALTTAGVSVIYAMLGVDMEEPDEDKKKEEANRLWRQFLGETAANIAVGGFGQMFESGSIDAMNYASYLINMQLQNDIVLDDKGEVMSFSKYSKERAPFYRYRSFASPVSLGMFDIGLDQAERAAANTKLLASEDFDNFTPAEKRLLYFGAISDWLYLMQFNDAYFARMVDKARREMINASKDREKQLKKIRSGR